MSIKSKTPFRIICVCVIFAVISLIYIVRMINIKINADPEGRETAAYVREEPILAVRGEIYDRNGICLVSNTYKYDFVFDSEAMAPDRYDRNVAILEAVNLLISTGNADKRTESSFPFDGTYPNYVYKKEARDGESNLYYRLLGRIAEDELESGSGKKKTELTVSHLDGFYKANSDKFPSEEKIINYFVSRYKLDAVYGEGQPLYSDQAIDKIIRVLYDMEVSGFAPGAPYVLAENVDVYFIAQVKEANIVGSTFHVSTDREYKFPGYASHILGRTGKIYAENWDYYNSLGYKIDAIVGIDGCEEAFEEYLRGIDGVMVIKEDEDGNIIEKYVKQEPVAGKNVYLTIDINLQIAAEDGLRANVEYVNSSFNADSKAGALVAFDAKSGGLLAVASYPTYDLTTFSQNYNDLLVADGAPLNNRALLGIYAPGSTFKPGMAAAAIDNGNITALTQIICDGVYDYYDNPKCYVHSDGATRYLTAHEAIAQSCNCYFYEMGRLMGISTMNKYCQQLGFGQKTGIEIGEAAGVLASPDTLDDWNEGETIRAAIGQSTNAFTPIQLASYIATLLNGGTRYRAHLLLEVREAFSDEAYYETPVEVLSQMNLSSAATDAVKQGMKEMVGNSAVVNSYMKNLRGVVEIGGKSGTAQVGGGLRDNGLFVCAAPYNNPDITICSVIERAGGGAYPAMAAARVLEAYYGVN